MFQFQLVRLKFYSRPAALRKEVVSIPTGSIKIADKIDVITASFPFQFQLVRLKSAPPSNTSINVLFQFQLVRLKFLVKNGSIGIFFVSIPTGSIKIYNGLLVAKYRNLFQFQLVRLKLSVKILRIQASKVSIPTGSIKILGESVI